MEEHKEKLKNGGDDKNINLTMVMIFTFLIASALGFYGGRFYERNYVSTSFRQNMMRGQNFYGNRMNRGLRGTNGNLQAPQRQEQPFSPNPTIDAVPQGQPSGS